MNQLPSPEEQKRIIDAGVELALKTLPSLKISEKDQEVGLRAFVAGFIAGHGWTTGEQRSQHIRN